MPRQEIFLHESVNDVTVEVVKTYDVQYAREVFEKLSDEAMGSLASALELTKNFAPADIPSAGTTEYEDFVWVELSESALEDVRQSPILNSFFVVSETYRGKTEDLYVCADWPSADKFAKERLRRAA
jgi:hypothetical protein